MTFVWLAEPWGDLGERPAPDKLVADLGTHFEILRASIKK